MSLLTQESHDKATDLALELLDQYIILKQLSEEQKRAIVRIVLKTTTETVILVKNRINNL